MKTSAFHGENNSELIEIISSKIMNNIKDSLIHLNAYNMWLIAKANAS